MACIACLEKELEAADDFVEQYNRNRDVKDHILSHDDIISGTETGYVDGGI